MDSLVRTGLPAPTVNSPCVAFKDGLGFVLADCGPPADPQGPAEEPGEFHAALAADDAMRHRVGEGAEMGIIAHAGIINPRIR